MTHEFLTRIAFWMQDNPSLAVLTCLVWGIFSVGLSPCQLATVSFLATPSIAKSTIHHKIPKLMLGHALALFGIGLILILFSFQLDILGHYWTVPFGILFLYMTKQLLTHKHCSHCSHSPLEGNFTDKLLKGISNSSLGFLSLGFAYGILSSTCVLIFLAPVLLLAKQQSLQFVIMLNAAFAIGHTLPIFIVSILAKSIHKLMCATDAVFTIPRRLSAIAFAFIGLVLIAHPFLELVGFDFHGHEEHGHHYDHKHHSAEEHKHEHHSAEEHKHE